MRQISFWGVNTRFITKSMILIMGRVSAFLSSSTLPLLRSSSLSPSTAYIANESALRSTLFPYQQEGSERLVQAKRLLLADEMGLGKTVQCIAAINKLLQCHEEQQDPDPGTNPDTNHSRKKSSYISVLIACPKSVLGVWEAELDTWLDIDQDTHLEVQTTTPKAFAYPTPMAAVCGGDVRDGSNPRFITIMMINYDLCHKYREELREVEYDIIICDEAHYLKSRDAKRTIAILGSDEESNADLSSSSIRSDYLWLLTGTPVLNRPVELYPLLRAIQPSEYRSFDSYAHRYCDPKKICDRRGNWRIDYKGSMNLPELSRRLKPIMLRRYKNDVLTQLPPKLRSYKVLNEYGASSKSESAAMMERRLLQEMMDSRSRNFESGSEGEGSKGSDYLNYVMPRVLARNIDTDDPDSTSDIMGIISSIRKETALRKVKPAIEMLKEIVDAKSKVVVFAHHRDVIQALVEHFGKHSVCVIGGMDVDARKDAVQKFQDDPQVHLFFGSIRAAGVGLTLTASSRVVFLELDWSPGVMSQAEDRCHRVGSKVGKNGSVQIQYYVFKDTIDEWIAKTLLVKQDNIGKIMGEAGTDTSKEDIGQSTFSYVLDFGKHAGLRIEDTPPDYLKFIVRVEAWRSRPKLWKALHKKGMVSEDPPEVAEETNDIDKSTDDDHPIGKCNDDDHFEEPTVVVDYVFDFGKNRGLRWNHVPASYRKWIIKESVWENRPKLKSALIEAGILKDDNKSQENAIAKDKFPIKSFRLTVQCPYIIEELKARNIGFDEEDKNKITKLKQKLLEWHEQESLKTSSGKIDNTGSKRGAREIEIIGCNIEDLWTVTKTKKPLQKKGLSQQWS